MIRARRMLVVLATVSLVLGQGAYAQEGGPGTILPSVTYEYGARIRFHAVIAGGPPIARATLFYRPSGATQADFINAEVLEAEPQEATAVLDVRSRPLRPFVVVAYWWQVDFADGSSQRTEESTFRYEDNRFVWQSLTTAEVTVHWVSGDIVFGQAALDTASEALPRIRNNLLLPPPDGLDVYIYPDLNSLQSGLRLGGRIQVGAHAIADLGVVLLVAAQGPEGQVDIERDLPHELTHVLLYERLGDRYGNLPTWLNEGLAVMQENVPSPDYRLALEDAAAANELLPLETLCAAFPIVGNQAVLAYAESASIVTYIRDIYGTGAILMLLDTYQDGATCAGGIQRVFRRSPEQLEREWKATSLSRPAGIRLLEPILPWTLLALPILLVIVYAILPQRFGRRPGSPPTE